MPGAALVWRSAADRLSQKQLKKTQRTVAIKRISVYMLAMPRIAIHPSRAIADLVRERRRELKLTLREVQERTVQAGHPIPFTSLAKVEKGEVDPGVRRLHLLLKLYHLPLQLAGDLLDLEDMTEVRPAETAPDVLYQEGVAFWKRGDMRRGLACLFALRHAVPKNPHSRLLRQKSLLSFAIVAGSLGKYRLSRQIADDLLLEGPDPTLIVPVLIQAAHCWHWLGSEEAALGFLARAETHVAPAAHQERAWILHEKASALVGLSEFKLADSALTKALRAYTKAGDVYGKSRAMAALTRLRFEQRDPAGALKVARSARRHAETHGFDRLKRLRRIDEGRAHMLVGNTATGLSVLNAALAESLAADDKVAQFHAHYYLWKAYTTARNRDRAELELKSAIYYVQFIDEVSKEALEIREVGFRRERK